MTAASIIIFVGAVLIGMGVLMAGAVFGIAWLLSWAKSALRRRLVRGY